ncbi:MAG: patatin-like phospholipase family protein [Anaerolineae bacterium]
MIAFVLSGGGSRGALEVGALRALFEAGIAPEMLVGSSVGALNATGIAAEPTLAGVKRLEQAWLLARSSDIFPGNWATEAWRFVTRQDSLYPSDGLRKFAAESLPPGVTTYGDIRRVKLYVTAANLNTASLYVYGDDPSAKLVDAAVTSAALPPVFPPVRYNGYQYVDGGVVANVPITVAIDKGATEIYALNLGYTDEPEPDVRGVVSVVLQTISVLLYQQLLDDLQDVARRPDIKLHQIILEPPQRVSLTDLGQSAALIAEGYRVTKDYLARLAAGKVAPINIEELLPQPAPPPPGAQIFPWRRRRHERGALP